MNATATGAPFVKGDYIEIPKGTPLYDAYSGRQPEHTKRKSVAQVTRVRLDNGDWTIYLTSDQLATFNQLKKEIADRRERLAGQTPYDLHEQFNKDNGWVQPSYQNRLAYKAPPPLTKEQEALYDARYAAYYAVHNQASADHTKLNGQYEQMALSQAPSNKFIVSWSGGEARAQNVTKANAPAPKKASQPNIRQQMVPGSRWRVTQDLTISYGAENPAFKAAHAAWDRANPRPAHNAPSATHQTWQQAFYANQLVLEKNPGRYTPSVYKVLPKGTEFKVTGKFMSYFRPFDWKGEHYANVAPVLIDGETDIVGLEYNQIKDHIEVLSIPTVDVWVLRHKPSGQYFAANNWEGAARYETGLDGQQMADTFMKGKKWDNLGKAKTSILMMTGYYDGLPGADESLPEWGGGGKTFDMTDDWELVRFDKLGRREVDVVADFQEWYARSWQLRALTVQFGSSVRTAYKALEKANLLDMQKGMLVFTETDEDRLDNVGIYGDKTAISSEEQDAIAKALDGASMKRGTYRKGTDHRSMAVSFPNKGAAMLVKLAYAGRLKTSVLDLETLTEAVDG